MSENEFITADFNTLMIQAETTIIDYMDTVINSLDDKYGEGYAENNPELVGALVTAMVMDFNSSIATKIKEHCMSKLSASVRNLADVIEEKDYVRVDIL